ncbi:MAG: glycerophosphodiester phosphodiesterase, partial [Acidimicrobiales bacterium]|nr:glycerophosphodiester phosphodiesterase [Acidimicrobiales bacterium]
MHPYLTRGNPRVLAHRGASKTVPPGNCAAAIEAAIEAGVDHIETDVQATADGEVVLFHDENLDEHTTGSGPLSELSWSAASELHLVADGEVTPHRLLRLEDALDRWPQLFWNIDVKTDDALDPTVQILRERDLSEQVCLAAFSMRRLYRLRRAMGPDWCT